MWIFKRLVRPESSSQEAQLWIYRKQVRTKVHTKSSNSGAQMWIFKRLLQPGLQKVMIFSEIPLQKYRFGVPGLARSDQEWKK